MILFITGEKTKNASYLGENYRRGDCFAGKKSTKKKEDVSK